jgi:hypothetical protein
MANKRSVARCVPRAQLHCLRVVVDHSCTPQKALKSASEPGSTVIYSCTESIALSLMSETNVISN